MTPLPFHSGPAHAGWCRLSVASVQTQSQDGRGFSLVGEHAGFIVDATNS
jgi:hypothetical protein